MMIRAVVFSLGIFPSAISCRMFSVMVGCSPLSSKFDQVRLSRRNTVRLRNASLAVIVCLVAIVSITVFGQGTVFKKTGPIITSTSVDLSTNRLTINCENLVSAGGTVGVSLGRIALALI